MNENKMQESLTNVIAEGRSYKGFPVPYAPARAIWLDDFNSFLDRIEAATKREIEKLNSVIQTQRSAFDAEQDRQRRKRVGNAAKIENALNEVCRMAFEIETSGNLPDDAFRNHHRAININSIANQAKNELALLSNPVKNDNSGAAIITTGNYARLREAVQSILDLAYEVAAETEEPRCKIPNDWLIETCKDALATPSRQCDVGTAKEQARRWEEFCTHHHKKMIGNKIPVGPCECPCYESNSCNYFIWAQMPYESEVADGNA